ncbi:GNAT family N-acetyltransferase [Microbacterium sp. UBA6633]|uniref:GNAT family N-acetyltransferase n=1 Tax=Microbacterium sp. UBA6633 TaxID=1946951 RepID=UPI0025E7B826|nr:GNAT family N-acetyltransferase [Microbacterium sp. UBA6633]
MITVRDVTPGDSPILLEWRNDPVTRASSLSTAPVDEESHRRWLDRAITDPDRCLYIGEQDGEPIGTVRLDGQGGVAEISITVAPAHRGRGLSLPLLLSGIEEYRRMAGSGVRIIARIRAENAISRALFASAGFREESIADDVLLLTWTDAVSEEAPS